MKFLKNLLGKNEHDDAGWKIKPLAERPAPRRRAEAAQPEPAPEKKEENPFLNQEFAEMEIVNDISPLKDDPYASNSWRSARESDTRKLKTLHIGKKAEEKSDEDFNPYDTGVFRGGWKD